MGYFYVRVNPNAATYPAKRWGVAFPPLQLAYYWMGWAQALQKCGTS